MAVGHHASGAEVVLARDHPICKAVKGTDHEFASWTMFDAFGGQFTPVRRIAHHFASTVLPRVLKTQTLPGGRRLSAWKRMHFWLRGVGFEPTTFSYEKHRNSA